MASVQKSKRKTRGGKTYHVWLVRYRTPAGDERTKTFRTRPDADAYAATVETQKLRGEYHDPALGRETLAEFYERRWLPSAPLRLRVSTLVAQVRPPDAR